MFRRTSVSKVSMVLSIASLLSLSIASFPAVAQEQPSNDNGGTIPDRRKPGLVRDTIVNMPLRRKPAGTRYPEELAKANSCRFDQEKLTALIPQNLLATTASASPTLFFSLPPISPATQIEFVLRDNKDRLVYETIFTGTDKAGIMSLPLPLAEKGQSLQVAREYHWYFSVICNHSDRAYDLVMEGLLQRSDLDAATVQQLAQASPIERVKLYQQHNLWQETFKTLVELKQSSPKDPTVLALWQEVLKSVDLEQEIAR